MNKKRVFDTISTFFLDSAFSLNAMKSVLEMLEEWGFEDCYNIFSSINLFFSVENDKYIFYIDDKSIFYNGNSRFEYGFGELFVSTSNVLRKGLNIYPSSNEEFSSFIHIPALKPIRNKYESYKNRYAKPTIEFIKEFYNDLLSVGFLEIVAILIIRDFLEWHSSLDELENYNPRTSTSVIHGLNHCFDSIISKDFFLYDNDLFYTGELYNTDFLTSIIPINGIPTVLYLNVSLDSLYSFDRYNIISKKYKIKICEHCKCFFIQNKDYDTKYCDDCKKISYEHKTKDPYMKIYRTRYKTMKMRASRSENQIEYEDNYTIPWANDVKSVMNNYKKNEDLTGFQKYLDETMQKYKP